MHCPRQSREITQKDKKTKRQKDKKDLSHAASPFSSNKQFDSRKQKHRFNPRLKLPFRQKSATIQAKNGFLAFFLL
jgi:hypothetical protein